MNLIQLKERLIAHKWGISYRLMKFPREAYHKRKARRNKNNSPTIICNNCVGGIILHDLGLKFNTPTINTLFFSFDEFYYFVTHLEAFCQLNIIELEQTEYPYPVGILQLNDRIIKIGFVHYPSFEEGRNAWNKRMKRINVENTFIIYESRKISTDELVAFSSIRYPKLVLSATSKSKEQGFSFYWGHSLYADWYPGKILAYKGFFSVKRYLDDFDYIDFLNNEV